MNQNNMTNDDKNLLADLLKELAGGVENLSDFERQEFRQPISDEVVGFADRLQTEVSAKRRVVCAALRNKAGRILCGPRHYDRVMQAAIIKSSDGWSPPAEVEQGFVDQDGMFLDRQEAWWVAQAAGQIVIRVVGDDFGGGCLFSENLY